MDFKVVTFRKEAIQINWIISHQNKRIDFKPDPKTPSRSPKSLSQIASSWRFHLVIYELSSRHLADREMTSQNFEILILFNIICDESQSEWIYRDIGQVLEVNQEIVYWIRSKVMRCMKLSMIMVNHILAAWSGNRGNYPYQQLFSSRFSYFFERNPNLCLGNVRQKDVLILDMVLYCMSLERAPKECCISVGRYSH
jgi:hypothetical protein